MKFPTTQFNKIVSAIEKKKALPTPFKIEAHVYSEEAPRFTANFYANNEGANHRDGAYIDIFLNFEGNQVNCRFEIHDGDDYTTTHRNGLLITGALDAAASAIAYFKDVICA